MFAEELTTPMVVIMYGGNLLLRSHGMPIRLPAEELSTPMVVIMD